MTAKSTKNEKKTKTPGVKERRIRILTEEKVLKAIPGTSGIYNTIAKKCGVTRQSLKAFVDQRPELVEAVKLEGEILGDVAESQLAILVKCGDIQAIKFYLSTKAKDRGYTTTQEQKHTGDLGFTFNYVPPSE